MMTPKLQEYLFKCFKFTNISEPEFQGKNVYAKFLVNFLPVCMSQLTTLMT